MFDTAHTVDAHRLSAAKSTEYQLYFAVGFAVALPIAVAGRLLPRRPGPFDRVGEPRRGVIAEAREMTNTVIPFVFMS